MKRWAGAILAAAVCLSLTLSDWVPAMAEAAPSATTTESVSVPGVSGAAVEPDSYEAYAAAHGDAAAAVQDVQVSCGWPLAADSGARTVTISVPREGLYRLELTYRVSDATPGDLTLAVLVDGALPFSEMAALTFPKFWQDDTAIRTDDNGSEFSPAQRLYEEAASAYAAPRHEDTPYTLFLSAGEHTVTLTAARGTALLLEALALRAPLQAAEYTKPDASCPTYTGEPLTFEGERALWKNSYRAEADFRKGDSFQIGFDRQNGSGTVYIWDLKLTKKDGDGTNLLKDPGFKNGKLTNWGAPGESVSGPFSVLEYDESLFTTIDPDDGKTYMIKLPGAGNVLKADDYVEGTGNWIYFGQAFRVKMGDVYTFSYNYYTERTTTALARISPLTRMDQPVVQTLMAHYIEGKMVVTFRVGEQQGHGTYMGEMTEEQKQQAQYDAATDTVFLWFGITPGYYGDSYVWNLSLKKQGSDVNLFDNPNFQRGGGTMSGWFLNGTNPGAVKKKLNFEVSELDRSIWKDKIIEVPEQEDPRAPNVNFTLERDSSQYDADHMVDPNIQNGGNTNFDTPDGSDVHTGERTHTAACATVSAVCLVLVTAAVLYPRLKRKKQR